MPADRPQAAAVRYDDGVDQAPRLLAKGKGTVAERILAIAREKGIPLYADQDLVTLLGVLDIDTEIPPRLYRALAEILAHLYRSSRK
jgi:flagellar biosynthesis protein